MPRTNSAHSVVKTGLVECQECGRSRILDVFAAISNNTSMQCLCGGSLVLSERPFLLNLRSYIVRDHKNQSYLTESPTPEFAHNICLAKTFENKKEAEAALKAISRPHLAAIRLESFKTQKLN